METRILPINFTPELDEMQKKDTVVVSIEKISITYIQPADTNSSSDEDQTLTIVTRCACSADSATIEEQDGYYFDITIPKEQHWSVSDGDELKALIDDFKSRLYMKQNNQQDDNKNNIQK